MTQDVTISSPTYLWVFYTFFIIAHMHHFCFSHAHPHIWIVMYTVTFHRINCWKIPVMLM
jgi:hypothetical protein